MSPLKWLNNMLFIENLLGVYRNYCNQEKMKKYLIMFQIFVQTMLHATLVVYQVYLILETPDMNQMKIVFSCFSVVTFINSLSSIMTGIGYSGAFLSFLESITRVSECFKNDRKLNNSLKRILFSGISFISFSFVFSAYRSIEALLIFSPSDASVILIPVMASQIIIKMIVVMQYFMLFVVLMIVVHSTKGLSLLVSIVQERVGSDDSSSDEKSITREQIQGWVELYQDLVNCCNKTSRCFGRQYFYSLVMSVAQYILATYQIFYTYILYIHSRTASRIAIVLFSYMAVMIIPLVAGQMTRNQGVKFHRVLARLYNQMIIGSGETEAKMIKDFIRLIKKNPLEIKLVSKVPTGMYMLPVILTLAVNYVIVMLQFNHVI